MTPDRWQQINELFHAALERDAEERRAFLTEACAGDDTLLQEVERLVAAHERVDGFIPGSAFAHAVQVLAGGEEQPAVGQRLGAYRIVREIGRGGMGAVYLAERADEQYEKRVSIKLIRRGMDTDAVLRHFRHERQILASLDHPNIARLLDGGTTDQGLPYFVMEYVEGRPIDEYCDAHRLSVTGRLELFRQVCSAVAYAHQHLVVHRDLKPSNILVTDPTAAEVGGVPKLLDFGIAKILHAGAEAETAATATGLRLMTPEYASPEQARGLPATTLSDVYSLGVVLYRLLSGHAPYRFRSRSPEEVLQAIRTTEPERPSAVITRVEELTGEGPVRTTLTPEQVSATREGSVGKLQRRLRGDLDNIVLMAIRKEPQRRYASVEQFSQDIQRHLTGLPVLARRDTLPYRGAKFVRRNRVAIAAAALVFLTLVGGIVTTTWQARRAKAQEELARTEQARAERRFNDVRRLAHSVLFDYHDAIQNLPGSTPVRAQLVRDALEYFDNLAKEANNDPSLQRELASAYLRVGDIQGRPLFPNLGDTKGAMESYRKVLMISERLAAADPTNVDSKLVLWAGYNRVGGILRLTGDVTGAADSFRKSLVVAEAVVAADPTNKRARHFQLISHYMYGDMLEQTGYMAEALRHHRQGLAIAEELVAAYPRDTEFRRKESIGHLRIGSVSEEIGDMAGALEHFRTTLALNDELLTADSMSTTARRDLFIANLRTGELLVKSGDPVAALVHGRKAFAIATFLTTADSTNAVARADLSNAHHSIANALAEIGDSPAALDHYHQALAIREDVIAGDPTNMVHRDALAEIQTNIGEVLAQAGKSDAALESYRKALESYEARSSASPADIRLRRDLASLYYELGDLHRKLASEAKMPADTRTGIRREACAMYRRSTDIWRDLRDQGIFNGVDAGKAEAVAREIARCEAAVGLGEVREVVR